jgi:hypothetical protein
MEFGDVANDERGDLIIWLLGWMYMLMVVDLHSNLGCKLPHNVSPLDRYLLEMASAHSTLFITEGHFV